MHEVVERFRRGTLLGKGKNTTPTHQERERQPEGGRSHAAARGGTDSAGRSPRRGSVKDTGARARPRPYVPHFSLSNA